MLSQIILADQTPLRGPQLLPYLGGFTSLRELDLSAPARSGLGSSTSAPPLILDDKSIVTFFQQINQKFGSVFKTGVGSKRGIGEKKKKVCLPNFSSTMYSRKIASVNEARTPLYLIKNGKTLSYRYWKHLKITCNNQHGKLSIYNTYEAIGCTLGMKKFRISELKIILQF